MIYLIPENESDTLFGKGKDLHLNVLSLIILIVPFLIKIIYHDLKLY